MVTAPCLVARKVGFLLEVLQNFVFSEAANLGSAIISVTRALNGADGTRGMLVGITYASNVRWIFLHSLGNASRSDVVSTVLNVQACSVCYSRLMAEIVTYAKGALKISQGLLPIFLLQKMTAQRLRILILMEVVQGLRRAAV